jgi:hypothetical protein
MNRGLTNLWATPVLYDKIEDNNLLNRTIDYILTNYDLDFPPSDFQKYDILKDGGDVLGEFKSNVVLPAFERYFELAGIEKFKHYGINSWLAGPKKDYYIPIHNHSGASLSAVFYLMCEDNKGGSFTLVDPKFNANRSYHANFNKLFKPETIMPLSGDIIIFPSYAYHYTMPFNGSLRLAIPVDLYPIHY